MGIVALKPTRPATSYTNPATACPQDGVEPRDPQQPIAQAPGFIGWPQIVVMGIAALNHILRGRRASTVMQQQVLMKGERWWATGQEVGLFECAMLSEKLELDRAREPLLRDIERDGRVYGR